MSMTESGTGRRPALIEQENAGRMRRALRRDATVLLFVIPALLLYGIYLLYPLLSSIWYSFLDWNGIADPKFVGLDNWRQLLQDSTVVASLRNTGIILAGSLFEIPVGLAIALVIQRLGRLGTVFSTIYVVPILISSIAVGVAWANILDPQFGPLYYIFDSFGQAAPSLLGDGSTAVWAISAVVLWEFVPSYILIFNAGLVGIPHDLYEAAAIDGAGSWACFRNLTIPLLKKTFVTAFVLIAVGSLGYFDLIFIMTSGGPGTSSYTLAYYVYHTAFMNQDIGYGSTLAVLLFIISIVISAVVIRFSRLIQE